MLDVRPATATDAAAIAAALEELDRFYGETHFDPAEQREHEVSEALFGPIPAARMIVAHEGSQLAGLASYSFLWPAVGTSRSLYLKELYVCAAFRRTGVGRILMHSLAETAHRTGCSRIEWTTDRENVDAQRFYESLPVPIHQGKLFYRVEITGPLSDDD